MAFNYQDGPSECVQRFMFWLVGTPCPPIDLIRKAWQNKSSKFGFSSPEDALMGARMVWAHAPDEYDGCKVHLVRGSLITPATAVASLRAETALVFAANRFGVATAQLRCDEEGESELFELLYRWAETHLALAGVASVSQWHEVDPEPYVWDIKTEDWKRTS